MKNKKIPFLCLFTEKVMCLEKPDLLYQVVTIIQRYVPGDYLPNGKVSNQGNYYSITINATHIVQVETL